MTAVPNLTPISGHASRRPRWLADDAIPLDLVERLHQHVGSVIPLLVQLGEWVDTFAVLEAEHEQAAKASGLDRVGFDDHPDPVSAWTGLQRCADALRVLEIYSDDETDTEKLATYLERVGVVR